MKTLGLFILLLLWSVCCSVAYQDVFIPLEYGTKTLDLSHVYSSSNGLIAASSADREVVTVSTNDMKLILTPMTYGSTVITICLLKGNNDISVDVFNVRVEPNVPPKIVSNINNLTLSITDNNAEINLEPVFTDSNREKLKYTAVSSEQAVVTVLVANNTITIIPVGGGVSTVIVTAVDEYGGTVSTSFTVTINIKQNKDPYSILTIPYQIIAVGVNANVSLLSLFHDNDNDQLTYSAEANDNTRVKVSIQGQNLILTAGEQIGVTNITVTTNDGNGGTATNIFSVQTVNKVDFQKITGKQGSGNINFDFSTVVTVPVYQYRQNESMTMEGSHLITEKVFTMSSTNLGTSNYWLVSKDTGKAVYIELTIIVQSNTGMFISDYIRGTENRGVIQVYSTLPGSFTGYTLKIHQYVISTQKNQVTTINIQFAQGVPLYIIIESTFYDYMDITPAYYYNEDTTLHSNNIILYGLVLLKDNEVIDVLGNTDPSTREPILPASGATIVRKKGIVSGSTTYSPIGEWDRYPANTYQYVGTHQI
jgi:hypothetical protein